MIRSLRRDAPFALAALSLATVSLAGCGAPARPQPAPAAPAPTASASVLTPDLRGYLADAAMPDSLRLLPPPPAPGSAALAQDQAVARALQALRGDARWRLARRDADLSFPAAAGTFACALGVPIDAHHTPRLYRLLERSMRDASASTNAAKAHYRRVRPFVANGQPSCTPEDEQALRGNGSYPSGHTAIGWTWALILAEAAPQRQNPLLARGLAFGQSRLVCNVHWQSDIVQGRSMAAATVAALHADAAFRRDLDAAGREIAAARAQALAPNADCGAEAAALAVPLAGVQ